MNGGCAPNCKYCTGISLPLKAVIPPSEPILRRRQTARKGRAGYAVPKKPRKYVECPLPTDQDTALPAEADDEAPSCAICTVNIPICVILPCMHKTICCDCGRKLTDDGFKKRGEVKCPICQAEVHKIAKVFE
jgi:hypothetical protein